jgi:CDP-glucose 4,6-dehydratase
MEIMEITYCFNNIYHDRKVLVTGHTGFKGAWLVKWLDMLGAKVKGISLKPHTNPNHFDLLNLSIDSDLIDIRNYDELEQSIKEFKPDIIFHLAAQSLVASSYNNPLCTISTNVMGSANLLEIFRKNISIKALIMITTDKVYKNKEWIWEYRENDELGGHDIYASSKCAVELITESYKQSLLNDTKSYLSVARAGNVIGGGDWNDYRLIPDIVKSINDNTTFKIRNPKAIRPWQHVLEPLSGYLILGEKLLLKKAQYATEFNFGPDENNIRKVEEIIEEFKNNWQDFNIENSSLNFKETNILKLNSLKAKTFLNWLPLLDFNKTIKFTINWYQNYYNNNLILTEKQIIEYTDFARENKMEWALK